MKKFAYLSLCVLTFGLNCSIAQTYQTQMLQDDPTQVLDRFIVVDVLATDIDIDFQSSNVYFGGSAYWPITEKLVVDAHMKLPYFQFGNGGFGITLEPGVYFKLITKNKTDDVPVVLESTIYADSYTKNGVTYNVDTYKFLNATGTYTDSYGARGGLYFRQGPFTSDDFNLEDIKTGSTLAGVYIGFQKVTQAFVELLVSGNGLTNEKFIGAGFTKMYFDVMILPVTNIADERVLDANERDGTFGFRAGFQWNKNPYDTPLFGRIVYSAEIGIRPLMGFYLSGGVGFKVFQD
jgi:hypothetical protein